MKERSHDSAPRTELRAEGAPNGAMDGVRGLCLQTPSLEKSPEARGLSQTMRDPARRKRNASPKTKDRVGPNGHGGESSSLTESPNGTKTNSKRNSSDKSERESAASDDATGTTFAGDAAQSSAAAYKGRDACAEVAAPRSRSSAARGEESGTVDDRRPRAPGDEIVNDAAQSASSLSPAATTTEQQPAVPVMPVVDDEPLAFDAPGFVDEMHARVNLYEVFKKLLTCGDLKVQQRAAEFLIEMKYGKGLPVAVEETPRIDFGDLPRPKR
jgi:hypothetical protein